MKERPILFSEAERRFKVAAARLQVPVSYYVAALNVGMKMCGGCRKTLPRDAVHFGTESKAFDRLRSRCRPCVAAAKKSHYLQTRPEQRARHIQYQRENRDRLYAYNSEWQRKRHQELRRQTIAAYGSRCNCCGEAQPIFLDLDHVNNDGAAHRRELGNGTEVMKALRDAGWPKDKYQLLCCNCNQGKARNGGVCPHAKSQY